MVVGPQGHALDTLVHQGCWSGKDQKVPKVVDGFSLNIHNLFLKGIEELCPKHLDSQYSFNVSREKNLTHTSSVFI